MEVLAALPHEFFRIEFDTLLEEGRRQERIDPENAGEAQEIESLHKYLDKEVLPLVTSHDWVFEAADRLAREWIQHVFDQEFLTGAQCYSMQTALHKLKEEVIGFVARASARGWTKKSADSGLRLKKASDFYYLLDVRRINDRAAMAEAQRLRSTTESHERRQVRLIMTALRDLYAKVFPQVMFVVKRAMKVNANLPPSEGDNKLRDVSEDLCWYDSRVGPGSALYLLTKDLRNKYRVVRNASSHPGQFAWLPHTNIVRFLESKMKQWTEFDVDEYHRLYRRLVLFCDMGIRGILSAYCQREHGDFSCQLVGQWVETFPDRYPVRFPGAYCIPYSVTKCDSRPLPPAHL